MKENHPSSYFVHADPGYLKISGPDRLDFLQRQTTNDLRQLSPGQHLVTVLTSPSGKIIDLLWVFDDGESSYGVITLPGQGHQTASFLRNRIFFMDKVSIEDGSQDILQVDLFGKATADMLQAQGFVIDPQKNSLATLTLNETAVKVLLHPHLNPRLLIPHPQIDQVLFALMEMEIQPLSSEAYQIMRIERGIPAAGHEMGEDYTPLEIGYQWAISANKGCYTGQEVIARQINYDKVTKHLVGLSIPELLGEARTLYSQEKNQPLGKITSHAISPRFGPIALAVVKRPYHVPGTELSLERENPRLKAVTHELPFQ